MQAQPLNICLLGGTGFVGTELAERLVHEEHSVRVATRNLRHGDELRVLDHVELCVANVHDLPTLKDLFAGMDTVINLVGILNEQGRATFQRVHTELAAKVVAAAHATGVTRLLHMSSLGASLQAPSRYLHSKAEAEGFIMAAPPEIATTIFRPAVIFGPGDALTNRFAQLLRAAGGVLPLARPDARFAPIYVLDVVEAFMRALHRPEACGRIYELCGPEIVTLEELVNLTARVAGLHARVLPLSDGLARLQGAAMELLPGKPFSRDNYRSLTVDCLCHENGCAQLGILPQQMLAVLPTYLGASRFSADHLTPPPWRGA